MIRRNTAGQVIYFPRLALTADGAAVTTGATLTVAKDGTESASAGTLAHSAGGVWKYTPTQAETDAAIVGLILTATDADPVVLNLVTTGADTSAVAFGANTTTPPTAVANATQVRTELATELGRIDAAISTRSTFAGGAVASVTDPVTVGTNNDKTGYTLSQAFPANFASLGINASGHLSRVTLVDTTTANSDMVSEPDNVSIAAILEDTDTMLPATLATILADTNEVQTDLADGGRIDLILDALTAEIVTSAGEPAQGAPPASASRGTKIDYLFKAWRNKKTQTGSALSLYADDGLTIDQAATVSDDGTTATIGEMGSGA